MKLMAVRRVQMAQSGKSDVPLPPAPPPHPGYAPNAALHGCMPSKDMLKSLLILNCKP